MTDLDIIKQIEKELNVELKELYIIKWHSKGYILNQNGQVTGLGLHSCKIENLDCIIFLLKKLIGLSNLNLSDNQLIEISQLKELKNLEELYLDNNKLIDCSPLKDLRNLTKLQLGNNQLCDISTLKDLDNIKELVLNDNPIRNILHLTNLKCLNKLFLVSTQVSNVSPLQDLDNLKELVIGYNPGLDLSTVKYLKNLNRLSIFRCQLDDILPLKELSNLMDLNLYKNRIYNIYPLKNLKMLTKLILSDNQISDISPLSNLKDLEYLKLENNRLYDISPLKDLKKLDILCLGSNQIEKLPSWIVHFDMKIQWKEKGPYDGYITFYDNPLKNPPPEIIKQGKEAVKNYFEQIEQQGKDNIFEAKLMLVGEPGSGKTTLMNLLFDKDFPVPNKKQKSTLGIEVRQNWGFRIDDNKDFKAHIWDFGGQQIQYMLHQFFLTSDCLYVLMAEKRRELANFDYWLNILNILGKNSPVVMLFNEINIDTIASFIYDEKKYKNLFPELSLQRLDVNLADISDGRFDALLHTIKKQLSRLELVGKEVPARWVDIRKELEQRRAKKHILINEYFEICRTFGIEKETNQMLILRYFHLLGIVLHFCEDENLCDTLFLDPNWTVDAIYSVLANKEIEKSHGFIKKSDLDKIWSTKGYEFEERAKLLQLMLKDKFELCYKLPGTQDNYIVPLLLSPQKPEYNWDHRDNLQFRFQYPFMPKGIVSRLIVRMHENIYQNTVWNEGVVFQKNGAMAQVIEQKTMKEGLKIIEIRLQGTPNNRKDLLTLIREEIKKIQNNSFPNLPYVEMVPCHCKECMNETNPYFFDYGDIETYLQKGKNRIDCRKSTEEVAIASLIGSVFNTDEIEARYKRIMDESKIYIDFKPNIQVHQEQQQHQEATQTATQQQSVIQEIRNVQGLFKNLKEDIFDEVDIEIKDEKEKQRIKNELEKVGNAFSELEKAAAEGKKELPVSTKSRIGEFIDKLSDENSRINKALRLVSKGADKVQQLGRFYNKVAPYFVLPSIPPVLLGKDESEKK